MLPGCVFEGRRGLSKASSVLFLSFFFFRKSLVTCEGCATKRQTRDAKSKTLFAYKKATEPSLAIPFLYRDSPFAPALFFLMIFKCNRLKVCDGFVGESVARLHTRLDFDTALARANRFLFFFLDGRNSSLSVSQPIFTVFHFNDIVWKPRKKQKF